MNLYGNDMDESTHPFESGLGWTVALEPRERALHRPRRRSRRSRARARRASSWACCSRTAACCAATRRCIVPGVGAGEITSGTFSPTLERSIALRARAGRRPAPRVQVDIRGKLLNARVVRPPFVRYGNDPLI